MNRYTMLAAIGALALLGAGCGDDDDTATTTGSTTTQAAETTEATTTTAAVTTTAVADTTEDMTENTTEETDATTDGTTEDSTDATTDATATPGTGSAPTAELADFCALAEEMDAQEGPPTPAQLTRYQELAPEEIKSDAAAIAEALLALPEGDLVAFFNVIGDDAIEARMEVTDAFEEENCGIPHSDESDLPEGTTQEIEDDAARVDVTALDFAFEFETPVETGRTSFVLTNEGVEAHFMLVVKLAEGVTMQEALEAEDSTGITEGEWDTKLAAAGGDEEAVTFDLEPGNYAMVCFIPTTDGTPHAFLGMSSEFTVDD